MNNIKTKKTILILCNFLILLGIMVSLNAALAAPAEPITEYYARNQIVSTNGDNVVKEQMPSLAWSSTSKWYGESDSSNQYINRTFDNEGAVKHHRDRVEIVLYQYGQGQQNSLIISIDGKWKNIDSKFNVLTAYPYVFTAETTYTIKRADIDPDAPYSIFTASMKQPQPFGSYSQNINYENNIYIYWEDEDRAAAPNVSFQLDEASGQMVLSGANASMEYRLKKQTPNDWKPCTDAPMYFDATTTSDVFYYVRYAATEETGKSSQTKEVILPAKRSIPVVTYSTVTEQITDLSTSMEIKFNDGDYNRLTASTLDMSDRISAIPADGTLEVRVRHAATKKAQASLEKRITIYLRGATPTGIVFDPDAITLSGFTATHYKLDTDANWKSMLGTVLKLAEFAKPDREVKVYVRAVATKTTSASLPIEFTIPQLIAGPTVTMDYAQEAVVGLENGAYQYSTNGTSWKSLAIADGTWKISSFISTTDRTFYLRKAATATTPISAYTTFSIPARTKTPTTPVFVYNDASHPGKVVLNGMTADMQYKKSTETDWTDVATADGIVFDIPASTITYHVRYKSIGQTFCSANKSIDLLKQAKQPGSAFNTTTEMLTALNDTMEIKFGSGAYTPIGKGVTSLDLSDMVNAIPAGSTLVVNVRYMEKGTAPASLEKSITIYPRGAAPTGVIYNAAAISLNGYTSAMQYKLDTDTGWKALSGKTFKLEPYAKTDRDVKLLVRCAATTTASASLPVEFTIPQLQSGPTGTLDYINETITGLENGDYQYSTADNIWTTVTVSDGRWDVSALLGSSNRTLFLRKAATASDPITAKTTLVLPARPKAPTTPVFVYNDEKHPGKVVLNGVTADMQYKTATDTTWTDVASDAAVVFDIPAASTSYYVRTKSTSETWASANKSLKLASKAAAPTCSYKAATETISGLSSTMEISFDGSAYTAIAAGTTTYCLTEMINNIQANGTLEIKVRRIATATAPASQDKVFTVNARTTPLSETLDLPEVPPMPEDNLVPELPSTPETNEGSAPPTEEAVEMPLPLEQT